MKLFITALLLTAGLSPAMAQNQAALSLASLAAPAVVPAEVPAPEAVKAPAQNWAEAAKAAVERELDAGGFTDYADKKELPPGARKCLERELAILPAGPGNSSEAFKLIVNGRTAFIIQSYIYSDSMRVYVFNAAGNSIAYGEGSVDKDFAWVSDPAQSKGMPARKDAFQDLPGCTVVDAMFFMQPTMPDAIKMLSGCLKDVEARYGFPVRAGVIAQGGARSISLTVPQNLPVGNRLLGDLRFSLEKRHNSLFGYPAAISAGAVRAEKGAAGYGSDLDDAINQFIKTRCKGFEVVSSDTKMVTHTVNWGIDDYIYTRSYAIRWFFDGTHPTQDNLSIKVVNRWEGDWYVFGGESNDVCDFSGLEYYSE